MTQLFVFSPSPYLFVYTFVYTLDDPDAWDLADDEDIPVSAPGDDCAALVDRGMDEGINPVHVLAWRAAEAQLQPTSAWNASASCQATS